MSSQLFFADNSDATKQLAIDPSAIATGTTRTIIMPDSDVQLGLANATQAGLIGAAYIHPGSPGTALPATSNRVGEIFIRTGATNPGLYLSLDLVGNWNGPLA